jgi:retinol dehydrogenase-12
LTKDGYEQQFGINVLGHFLLCWILARKTKRQVWLSSYGHTLKGGPRINLECVQGEPALENYDGFLAYQQSKLGNILLAKEFCKRFPGLEAVSVHPGTIHTSLYRDSGIVASVKMGITMIPGIIFGNISQVFPKTASMGASTTLTCATLPSEQLVNGGYYSNCAIATESAAAKNEADAKALYDFCEAATKPFQSV